MDIGEGIAGFGAGIAAGITRRKQNDYAKQLQQQEDRKRIMESLIQKRLSLGETPESTTYQPLQGVTDMTPQTNKGKLTYDRPIQTADIQRPATEQDLLSQIEGTAIKPLSWKDRVNKIAKWQDDQIPVNWTADTIKAYEYAFGIKPNTNNILTKGQLANIQEEYEKKLSKEQESKIGIETKIFDPVTKTFTDAGTIQKGTRIVYSQPTAEQAGYAVAKKEQAIRREKLGEMFGAIDFFEEKINEVPSGEGLFGRAKGVGLKMGAFLQTNPQAAAYESTLNGLRSQIARGLGEVGNLAEKEQENAINLLPKLTDNTETRKAKLDNFKDFVFKKLNLDFNSPEEADRANLPIGTKVRIKGRMAIIE